MKRALIFVLIAGIAIVAMSAFQHLMKLGRGDVAPLFTLASVRRGEVALEGYRGRPVLLHFFATWCGPCVAEFPALGDFADRFLEEGMVVLAIAEDEDIAALKAFVERMGPGFHVLIDEGSRVANAYNSYAVPETFFVDGEGVIQWRRAGPVEWDSAEIREKIGNLITK